MISNKDKILNFIIYSLCNYNKCDVFDCYNCDNFIPDSYTPLQISYMYAAWISEIGFFKIFRNNGILL